MLEDSTASKKYPKVSNAHARLIANKITLIMTSIVVLLPLLYFFTVYMGLNVLPALNPHTYNQTPFSGTCYQLAIVPNPFIDLAESSYTLASVNPTHSAGCGLFSYKPGTYVIFTLTPGSGFVNPQPPAHYVMIGTLDLYDTATPSSTKGVYIIQMGAPVTEYVGMQPICWQLQLIPLFGISSYSLSNLNPTSSPLCSYWYGSYWYAPGTTVTFDLAPLPGYINPTSTSIMEGTYTFYSNAKGTYNNAAYQIGMVQPTTEYINMVPAPQSTSVATTTAAPASNCPNTIYSSTMSLAQIEACASQAGFSGGGLETITSIAWAESSFNAQDASGLLGNNDNQDCRLGGTTCYNPATCASGATNWHRNPTCEFKWAAGYVIQYAGITCPSGGVHTYCYWGTYTGDITTGGRAPYCLFMPTTFSGENCPSGLNEKGFW